MPKGAEGTVSNIPTMLNPPTTVTAVSTTLDTGLHNPLLTNGHFPVVDGLVTSFNTIPIVTLDSYVLPYALPLCLATKTCDGLRRAVHALECALSSDGSCKARHYVDGLTLEGRKAAAPPVDPAAAQVGGACAAMKSWGANRGEGTRRYRHSPSPVPADSIDAHDGLSGGWRYGMEPVRV